MYHDCAAADRVARARRYIDRAAPHSMPPWTATSAAPAGGDRAPGAIDNPGQAVASSTSSVGAGQNLPGSRQRSVLPCSAHGSRHQADRARLVPFPPRGAFDSDPPRNERFCPAERDRLDLLLPPRVLLLRKISRFIIREYKHQLAFTHACAVRVLIRTSGLGIVAADSAFAADPHPRPHGARPADGGCGPGLLGCSAARPAFLPVAAPRAALFSSAAWRIWARRKVSSASEGFGRGQEFDRQFPTGDGCPVPPSMTSRSTLPGRRPAGLHRTAAFKTIYRLLTGCRRRSRQRRPGLLAISRRARTAASVCARLSWHGSLSCPRPARRRRCCRRLLAPRLLPTSTRPGPSSTLFRPSQRIIRQVHVISSSFL